MIKRFFGISRCHQRIVVLTLAVSFLLSNAAPLFAQGRQAAAPPPNLFSPQMIDELKRVQQAALASDYAYRQVAHLSNNIGPRLSGSAQAQQAVEYVAGEMRRLGLEVQLEKLMVPHWMRGLETAELTKFVGQAPNTTQKVVLTALGGSVATPPEGLTAEVVVANSFDELQALGRERVVGKIVLFNNHFDKAMAAQGFGGEAYGQAVAYRGGGPSAASRLGAVAVLIRSVGSADFRLPHTGATRYAEGVTKIPAAAVAAEDADLMAYLATQGALSLHLTLTPKTEPDAPSFNVIGDLKGSEHPEQIVIVSGHLDSWDLGTGAIDDAAGVAVALQTAQLMKQLNLHPKRTVRVIAWMNEENGLVGGRTYATDHAADMANHFAAIESDLGAGHPLGFNFKGKPEVVPMLAQVAGVLESQGSGLMKVTEGIEADITPVATAGVPAFGLWQDSRTYFHYHHTAADTLDKIVPRELAENAAAMAVLADALANMEQGLPR